MPAAEEYEDESASAEEPGSEDVEDVVEEDSEDAVEEDVVEDSKGAVEELTVTARRREELLQEVPMSVTAFSETEIDARGVKDLSDIAAFTPNMRFDVGAASSTNASVFIRGVGQTEGTINADPKVGIYLDGVYQARSLGTVLSTWDVQRVEVIRGPQGTLFGKNAIGGALQVITNKPGPEWEAAARMGVANKAGFITQLMLNAPIDVGGLGDMLFVRGSFQYETRDGFVYDVNLLEDFSSQHLTGGRVALRFDPSDDFDMTVTYWNQKQPVKSARGECEIKQTQNEAGVRFLDGVTSDRAIGALGGEFEPECDRSKPLVSSSNVENKDELDTMKIHALAEWTPPEVPGLGLLHVDSTTAYQSLGQEFAFEADSTALPLLEADIVDLGHWQFSQELQVSGSAFDERFYWTLGAYYLHESKGGEPDQFQGMQPEFEFSRDSGNYFPLEVTGSALSQFEHHTASGYAFGGFDFDESWSMTAGIRYGWEKKNLQRLTQLELCSHLDASGECSVTWEDTDGDGLVVIGPYEIELNTERYAEDSWSAPTGHLGLQYKINDDANVYGAFQRGYSSGGFNYLNADTEGAPQAFEPETLTGFELGFKSTWFDRDLVVNAAYYFDYYQDKHVRTRVADSAGTDGLQIGVSDAILNAGDSIIQGAELEVSATPFEGLLLHGGLGLQFNHYQDFEVLDEDATRAATEAARQGLPDAEAREIFIRVYEDISSNDFPYMPNVNFNLVAQYTREVAPWLEVTAAADYAWQSKMFFDPINTPELSQGAYGALNFRLTGRNEETDTEVSFWVKNSLDERTLSSGYSLGAYVSRYYGAPRTYGVTFTQRFGGE